eukprot:scaffold30141_cov29-Tisochrysis_lutea.AAC.3
MGSEQPQSPGEPQGSIDFAIAAHFVASVPPAAFVFGSRLEAAVFGSRLEAARGRGECTARKSVGLAQPPAVLQYNCTSMSRLVPNPRPQSAGERCRSA